MTCPFCGDTDFDTVGLKSHLLNYCEEFEKTETVLQERLRKERENSTGIAIRDRAQNITDRLEKLAHGGEEIHEWADRGPGKCHICGEATNNHCDPCGKPACNDCASTSMAYGIETYACGDCRRSKEDHNEQ